MFCGIIRGVLQVVEAIFKVQFHFQKMCGPIENVNQIAVIWKSFEVCVIVQRQGVRVGKLRNVFF